jgi:molybdopterin converting factor small subunit
MFPWLWLWAPQFYFPWSGSVAQNIEPDTDWFFGTIQPEAGNAQVEKRVFGIASYGKQLGLITDVLLELTRPAREAATLSPEAAESFDKLDKLRTQIQKIKDEWYEAEIDEVLSKAHAIRRHGGSNSDLLNGRLLKFLKKEGLIS